MAQAEARLLAALVVEALKPSPISLKHQAGR